MDEKVVRINPENPRSMYLFYARVMRVLMKNHNNEIPPILREAVYDLESDAEYYYRDLVFEINWKRGRNELEEIRKEINEEASF